MTDVFISYAREDAAQAERITRGLEAMGLSVFWDNEIPPGQTWADYIEGKLNQCGAAVVLWSHNSTKSQWVREEARMGRNKLVPAKLDASEPPFGFGDVQAADLSQWTGDYNHPQWSRFANAVFAKARGQAAPQAAAPPPAPQASGWQTPQPAAQQPAWSVPQSTPRGAAASSPIAYIQKCLRLYVDGKGRARRSEYGWFALTWFVVLFVGILIDALIFGLNEYTSQPYGYFFTYAALALLPPLISVGSRRAHDLGQTGWLAALTPLPYVGWIAVLALTFIPGNVGPNQHGPDPKAP